MNEQIRGPRPPRPPSICCPPEPCPPHPKPPECPPDERPPMWWLVKHGYVLEPKFIGHPVHAALRFKPNPLDPRLPRLPWPNETESRAAGTGLLRAWGHKHDYCHDHDHNHNGEP